MRFVIYIGSSCLATLAFWTIFIATLSACLDTPLAPSPPAARIQASWDPLACGPPHRVAIELEDDGGAEVSSSAPCTLGGIALDLAHFGVYRGRVYAWEAGEIRSVTPVRLDVDQPVLWWQVETPL